MSDLRIKSGQISVNRRPNDGGGYMSARGIRDGSLVTVDWLTAMALEGRVFRGTVGSATTPTSFAKTTYDADQPQFVVDVPSTAGIVPVRLRLVLEDSAGTDNEVFALSSTVNVGAGTSTAVTAVNTNTASSNATACSVYSLYTGNGTDPTTGTESEFWRATYAFADATTDPAKIFQWSAQTDGPPPVIAGTGSLVVYIVGATTAPAGYLVVEWVELADEYLK